MRVGVSGERGAAAVMTLITEKLQEQSLYDGPRSACAIGLRSEKLSQTLGLYPCEFREEKPWRVPSGGCAVHIEAVTRSTSFPFMSPISGGTNMDPGLPWYFDQPGLRATTCPEAGGPDPLPTWISRLNLNENVGSPLAPPTKRHCRSLSEPDELARSRSPWKPGSGSKIWTPISKRRCNSGGVASLQCASSHGSTSPAQPLSGCSSSCGRGHFSVGCGTFALPTSPVPRPSSASSGFADCSGRSSEASSSSSSSSAAPWPTCRPPEHVPGRRLSLSQEHIPEGRGLVPSGGSSPTSTPDLGRRPGLLRCRSQPCVLQERKAGLKRPRESEARWSRPSLDFLKMTQTLKNSKSLCSLDDDDHHMRTIVSSPCDSGDLLASASPPGSGPAVEPLEPSVQQQGLSLRGGRPLHAPLQLPSFSEDAASCETDDEDTSDCESVEDRVFPLYCGDLDLEQIENN